MGELGVGESMIDVPDELEYTTDHELLCHYCQNGAIEEIKYLLKQGIDLNAADHFHNTALFYAALAGQAEVVELLVEYGANVDAKNHNHYTAVQRAAEEGHFEVVKILVNANADIHCRDLKWGATPLLCATYWGFQSIVRLLLENKARVTGLASHFGYTSLHLACMKGHTKVMSDLIRYGADVNARAQNGVTPLIISLGPKLLTSAKMLLDHGASVDLQDNRGEFALYCAAQIGWCKAVKLFLFYGSDIQRQTKLGDTAIHAACYGKQVDVVKFLLPKYPDAINMPGYQGNTPLHIAATKQSMSLVKFLLHHGASINRVNSNNETPADIARNKGYTDIQMLLQMLDKIPEVVPTLPTCPELFHPSNGSTTCETKPEYVDHRLPNSSSHSQPDFSDQVIIDQAMDILRKQCPNISGLHTVSSQKSKLIRPQHPLFVQILKFKSRFILMSTLNLPAGHIELFDPFVTGTELTSSIVRTVSNLMSPSENQEFNIYHIKVKHRFNATESALVCLAVLIGVLFTGQCPSPSDLTNTSQINKHMKYCLKKEYFSVWYNDKIMLKSKAKTDISAQGLSSDKNGCRGKDHEVTRVIVDLHCICHSPCAKYVKRKCLKCYSLYHSCACTHSNDEKHSFRCYTRQGFICPDCTKSQCLMTKRLLTYPAKYDAFVSYSYTDFWFIKKHLLPQLENAPYPEVNLELVIAHRDFLPGSYIAETITETVIHSRQCIAVISKNFFKGHWNDFEWEQMVVHKWKSMVLILLDPVDEIVSAEWMPTLNSYLKTRFFLEWKQDYTCEEITLFWKSLRNFLGPRH